MLRSPGCFFGKIWMLFNSYREPVKLLLISNIIGKLKWVLYLLMNFVIFEGGLSKLILFELV